VALDVRLSPIQVGDVVAVLPSELTHGIFWLAKVLATAGDKYIMSYFERVMDFTEDDTYEDPTEGILYFLDEGKRNCSGTVIWVVWI